MATLSVRPAGRLARIAQVAVLAAAACVLLLPSLLHGPGVSHSAQFNLVWTVQFGEALAAGDPWPRWLPGSFEGLGSPSFFFYPPLAFLLAGGLVAAGLPASTAITLAALLLLLASGVAMLAWLRGIGARLPLAGALLYMAAPYHLLDFHGRGALAEFGAFVWLPLIALAVERAGRRRGATALLAVAYAALILTHTPSALLASLFLIVPQGMAAIRRDRRALLPLALGLGTGIALAAAYLVPALLLQSNTNMALMVLPYYQPRSWSLWSAVPPVANWEVQRFAGFALLPGLVGAIALAGGAAPRVLRLWPALALATAVVAAGLLPWLWAGPLLERVQFPWRLLTVTEFAAVTTIVTALDRRRMLLLALPFLLLSLLALREGATAARPASLFALWQRNLPDAMEYLPRGLARPEISESERRGLMARFHRPPVSGGRIVVTDGDILEIEVAAPGPVTVRRFAFPVWRVDQNGHDVPVRATYPDRLITFVAGSPGRYRLTRVHHPTEKIGAAISLAGLAMLLALLLSARPRARGAEAAGPAGGPRG